MGTWFRSRFGRAAVVSIVTLVVSVGAGAAKDTLQIGILAEFESLNPMIQQQAASSWVLSMAHRKVFALTPDGKWYSPVFKKVPTVENKLARIKGKTLESSVEILDEAKWGDGTPITCKDLELSWQIGKSDNVSVPEREPYDMISEIRIDAANPKKCVVVMNKVVYNYLNMFPELIPAHLEAKVFEEFKGKPQGYDQNSLYVRNPTNPGLWFGPFVVTEVKLGSHIILAANPQFYGKKPYFKKVVVKLLPNANTHISNIKSGSVDMIASAGGIGLDQAVVFDKETKRDNLPYVVVFQDGIVYAHVDFNLDNPILADLKVRRALSYGFNKKEMIETILEGKGIPAIGNVTPTSPWFNDKVMKYGFDKKMAAKLLDEAGWKLGPDGFRAKDGKRMTLQMMAVGGVKMNDLLMTYMQAQLKAIGVEITIKTEPARVFFGETVKKRQFDLALYAWSSQPESSPRSQLHSSSIPSAANSYSGQNSPGYKNAEVDKLIDELEVELNNPKRYAIAKKILAHYAEDVPVLPLYFRPVNSIVPKDLKGFRLSGHLFYETLAIEDWHY